MQINEALTRGLSLMSGVFVAALSTSAMYAAWFVLTEYIATPWTATDSFYLCLALGLGIFWMPLAWLVMNHVTPGELNERYLKEPHFTVAEIVSRAAISPLLPFPTTMFMIACTLPRNWLASRWLHGRKMADLRDHAPRWFVWCSRIIWVSAVVHGLVWAGSFIGLLIYAKFLDA